MQAVPVAYFFSRNSRTKFRGGHRAYAYRFLLDEGFASEGRFSGGRADWFVIGGRWSGDLTRLHLSQRKLRACDKEFEKKYGWWIGGEDRVTDDQRKAQYAEVFRKHFPDFDGLIPAWRDQYAEMGCDDDAMIVDDAISAAIKKETDGSDYFCDSMGEDPSRSFIGTRWARSASSCGVCRR